MKRILLITVSAGLCGILIMLLPLYLWHQANFPDMLLLNPLEFRGEITEYYKTRCTFLEPISITTFYTTLAISFAISVIAYAFFKRRL